MLAEGAFSGGDTEVFRPLIHELLEHDEYLLLADYRSYVEAQRRVDESYRDRSLWSRMSILNVARCGKFSSDRAIREYAESIWRIEPVPID
jgi:starch phosphorylase